MDHLPWSFCALLCRFRSFFDYNNKNRGGWCCNIPRTTSMYIALQCNNNCLFSLTSWVLCCCMAQVSVESWELFKVKVFRKTLPKDDEQLLGKNFIAFAVLGSPIWFYTVGDRGFSFWWWAGWLSCPQRRFTAAVIKALFEFNSFPERKRV